MYNQLKWITWLESMIWLLVFLKTCAYISKSFKPTLKGKLAWSKFKFFFHQEIDYIV